MVKRLGVDANAEPAMAGDLWGNRLCLGRGTALGFSKEGLLLWGRPAKPWVCPD